MSVAKAPIIGITVDSNEGQEKGELSFDFDPKGQTVFWLKQFYTDAVEAAGGVPILLPVTDKPARIKRLLALIDGLIVSGGDFDIDPSLFGEKILPQCGALKRKRTEMEMKLFRSARRIKMPILGICGGHQVINVAFGGDLYQDIPTQHKGAIRHEQKPVPPTKPGHTATVMQNSLLQKITGATILKINSTHHQAVRKVGRGLMVSATAPDGVIEAIEPKKAGGPFLLGVQWHPESLYGNDEPSREIFARFITEAENFARTS